MLKIYNKCDYLGALIFQMAWLQSRTIKSGLLGGEGQRVQVSEREKNGNFKKPPKLKDYIILKIYFFGPYS